MAIALFSYLGVETAAGRGRQGARSRPQHPPGHRSCGTLATAVVYMLSLIAVFGILPARRPGRRDRAVLRRREPDVRRHLGRQPDGASPSSSPASEPSTGWTMICAEMPLAAANDGLFPERFKRLSRSGVPAFGIVTSTVLASDRHDHQLPRGQRRHVFTTLVLMTGITAAIPYAFSALAQLKWCRADHRAMRDRTVRPGHGRRRRLAGLLRPVHLVLAQHRPALLAVLGPVPAGRRSAAPRHTGLPSTAQQDERPSPVPPLR